MIIWTDERFREEALRYVLRFACPDCVHFCPEDQSCSNGFPTQEHLDPAIDHPRELVFCKLFELA